MPPVVPASASVWQPPQPFVGEDRLAVGRAAAAAGLARPARRRAPLGAPCRALSSQLSKSAWLDDVRGLAHDGVAEAAQLGADDGVFADAVWA